MHWLWGSMAAFPLSLKHPEMIVNMRRSSSHTVIILGMLTINALEIYLYVFFFFQGRLSDLFNMRSQNNPFYNFPTLN